MDKTSDSVSLIGTWLDLGLEQIRVPESQNFAGGPRQATRGPCGQGNEETSPLERPLPF